MTISAGTEVTADTFDSSFDTVLVVYTGASLGSLSEIACNDDGGGDVQSQVGFTASSSTTYWIQVSGFAGSFGNLDLNVVATTPGADVSVSVADSADPVSLGGDNVTYPERGRWRPLRGDRGHGGHHPVGILGGNRLRHPVACQN